MILSQICFHENKSSRYVSNSENKNVFKNVFDKAIFFVKKISGNLWQVLSVSRRSLKKIWNAKMPSYLRGVHDIVSYRQTPSKKILESGSYKMFLNVQLYFQNRV